MVEMFLTRCVLTLVLLAVCGWVVHAQSKPVEPPRASAVKLPDGTVVFVSKKPDEPNPIVDGVVLSATEYQSLVEQAEALKAQRDAKPVPASKVELTGRIEARGERAIAAVTAVFTFRTTQPKLQVALGCGRALAVGVKAASGKLPLLTASADGFGVLVESAGDHTLTLDLEVPVSARGQKGEIGFEFGLPRAAISTFALAKPPAGVKKLTVGTRTGEAPNITRYTSLTTDALTKPLPLGPTDILDVSWEPTGPATPSDRAVEADVSVRVSETQIETVAKLKLQGDAAEWPLTLPVNADVIVERVGDFSTLAAATAIVFKPIDPNKPVWLVRTPIELSRGYWLVTVTVRVPRTKPTDPATRERYPIGPFHTGGAKPTAKWRVYAPPTMRVGFRTATEFRRQDLPANADEDLIAVFAAVGTELKPVSWAELDVRPVPNTVRVRPQHKLRWTPTAWRLETLVRVIPPPRGEVDQTVLEFPTGWQGIEFTPSDLVEAESVPKDGVGRTVVARFASSQKVAFDFTVTATFPYPPTVRELTVPFPRFPQADERETKVTVSTDGWTIGGTGYGWEGGQPAASGDPLKTTGKPSLSGTAVGEFDRGLARLDLRWQPHRTELGCEMRTDLSPTERQLAVTQTFKFRPAEGDTRPIRLKAVGDLIGFRSTPRLEPLSADEWELKHPVDAGKELTLNVQFAVKLPAGKGTAAESLAVPMLWPQSARTDATVRVWGGGRRVSGYVGRWRELPPEITPEFDSLPILTLMASGDEPLALRLNDPEQTTGTVVERALIQAVIADDGGAAIRGRFVLRRWSAGGIDLEIPNGAEVLVDGKRVEPVWRPDAARVIVPDPRPGKPLPVIEVRYLTQMASEIRFGRALNPPQVRGATYRNPMRWSVSCGQLVPLVPGAGAKVETRWGWRGYGFGPTATESATELDQWLRDGAETLSSDTPFLDSVGESLLARQSTPAPLNLVLAPRSAWVIGAACIGFAVVVGLTRLYSLWLGVALVSLAIVGAAFTLLCPQPAAQFVTAAQPGMAAAVLALLGRAIYQRYRPRERRPPTFQTLPAVVDRSSGVGSGIRGTTPSPAASSDPLRIVGS